MISFKREGKEVHIRFDHGITPGGWSIIGGICPDKVYAQLLVDRLTHELKKALSKKIEQSYLEGCKDTRHHKKKKTKFVGTLDNKIW